MPKILLPAKLESCATAMDFLRKHLADEHENMLGFVELAVEELLVNVVDYAYAGEAVSGLTGASADKWGMLELGFRQVSMDDVPFLCVWIRDWGAPFDPFLEAPKPDTSLDIEERPVGGLGVHLVIPSNSISRCRPTKRERPRAISAPIEAREERCRAAAGGLFDIVGLCVQRCVLPP